MTAFEDYILTRNSFFTPVTIFWNLVELGKNPESLYRIEYLVDRLEKRGFIKLTDEGYRVAK